MASDHEYARDMGNKKKGVTQRKGESDYMEHLTFNDEFSFFPCSFFSFFFFKKKSSSKKIGLALAIVKAGVVGVNFWKAHVTFWGELNEML